MQSVLISGALSLVCWLFLSGWFPWRADDPLLTMLDRVDPVWYTGLWWSWKALCFAAPFCLLLPAVRAVYGWESKRRIQPVSGHIPPMPQSTDLQVALGVVEAQDSSRSWAVLGERALTRDILMLGARGAGKTSSGIMPILKQFIAYKSGDPEHKMSGIVLEVKDTMADDVERLMQLCGRGSDLVRIGLTGWRYNPLHNEIEPKTLATSISNLLRATYGGKVSDDFWVTGPIAAMCSIITIYRLADGYCTLADVYEAISNIQLIEEKLEKLEKIRGTVGGTTQEEYWAISEEAYQSYKGLRPAFTWEPELNQWIAPQSDPLLVKLKSAQLKAKASGYEFEWHDCRKSMETQPLYAVYPERDKMFQAMEFWYKYGWKGMAEYVRRNVASSITDKLGIFYQNPAIRETFCPPLEAYSEVDPGRPLLTSFDDIIGSGKVAVMDLPSTMDPMGARLIGLLTSTDWQASQLRRTSTLRNIPDADRRRSFEIIDEFQYFVIHHAGYGTHRYMEIKRETLCTLVAATQSISALDSEVGVEARRTIVGLFGNVGIFRCDDEETAEWAAKFCGDEWRPVKSWGMSESGRNSKVILGGPSISQEKGVGVSENVRLERIKRFYPDDFRRGLPDFTAIWSINDGSNTARPVRCRMLPVHREE